MKRLLFGLAAIIFAAATAAFTTPTSNRASLDDAYFEFNYALYSPSIANVEDESKWVRVSDMNSCSNQEYRACKIRVSDQHYSANSLLSSADIQADESASNVAFVADAEAVQIINKANP